MHMDKWKILVIILSFQIGFYHLIETGSHYAMWGMEGIQIKSKVLLSQSLLMLAAWPQMSLVMRKTAFCICENKDADQLHGNREADQRLCFRYTDSTIPFLSKSEIYKPLAIFCDCPVRFVSDLIGNPEDRFSHNEAQTISVIQIINTVG